jgi:hypothetical protein
MGENFNKLFWITVKMMPGGTLQLLPQEDMGAVASRLWLKLLLVSALHFVPLLSLQVLEGWLGWISGSISVFFSVPTFFAAFDVILFYALPGIRLDESTVAVKARGFSRLKQYVYSEIASIRQTTSTRKWSPFSLELVFRDGTIWHTDKCGKSGLAFLVDLSNAISQKSQCSVSPVFEVGRA